MKKSMKSNLYVAMLVSLTMSILSCNESDPIPAANDLTSQVNSLPAESISAEEENALIFIREEEKVARDVYITLYAKWKLNVFNNISSSEQQHMDAVLLLLNKYRIHDPVGSNGVGILTSSTLQELYNQLIDQGNVSMVEALKVGATIEDLDIFDITHTLQEIDNQHVIWVFQNLTKGSRNHLRSFYSNLISASSEYVPQYITQEEFDAIVSSPTEKGY